MCIESTPKIEQYKGVSASPLTRSTTRHGWAVFFLVSIAAANSAGAVPARLVLGWKWKILGSSRYLRKPIGIPAVSSQMLCVVSRAKRDVLVKNSNVGPLPVPASSWYSTWGVIVMLSNERPIHLRRTSRTRCLFLGVSRRDMTRSAAFRMSAREMATWGVKLENLWNKKAQNQLCLQPGGDINIPVPWEGFETTKQKKE